MKIPKILLVTSMLVMLFVWAFAQRTSNQISLPQVDPSFEYEAEMRSDTPETEYQSANR